MAHGYIGDGYGIDGEMDSDRDRDDDRHRQRSEEWRQRGEHWRVGDRDRGTMSADRDRGWLREDRNRSFSAHPDDHYRSWRDRHMSELDRDYRDYCREREQQFHQDFDSWRNQRRGNPQPLRTGMTQTGLSHDPSGEFELTNQVTSDQGEPDAMADATLGTTSGSSKRR